MEKKVQDNNINNNNNNNNILFRILSVFVQSSLKNIVFLFI